MCSTCAGQATANPYRLAALHVPEGAKAARVYRPRDHVAIVAGRIAEASWTERGVRVFCWPCGVLAVPAAGSKADVILLRLCEPMLLATYCRAAYTDVLEQLRAARRTP